MKRISSVCMAATRQTLWKLLLIVALMAAVELGVFWYQMPTEFREMEPGRRYLMFNASLYWFLWALRGATVLLFVLQAYQGCDSGGKLTYTLRRLPMGERAVTTLWAVVHMAGHWILWAAQLAVVLVCWRKYCSCYEVFAPTLERFTQFYRGDFLHGLLPLADLSYAICLGLQMVTLGVAAAYYGFVQRKGKWPKAPILVLAISMAYFPAGYDNYGLEIALIVIDCVFLSYMLWQIWWGDYEEA